MKISAPKGTRDITPLESYKWQYIENIARIIAQKFNILEVRLPSFEHTELFHRGVGDSTDVVQKEMYTFLDKGNRSITLRPEGTASTVRMCLEHSLLNGALPLKTSYFVKNFRYEKPEAGRLREHHQFGIEYFGSSHPSSDAEVISVASNLLTSLGITDTQVSINSIGCSSCRPLYHEKLREYFSSKKDCLCDLCVDRLERNPMRLLDCKNEKCKENAMDAPSSIDHLCTECDEHFEGVKSYLSALDIPFAVDTSIVRGLDYYSKTVFEFVSKISGLTICGGGRYDGLVEMLGGKPTPALGFGCGIERLIMLMEEQGASFGEVPLIDLFVASTCDKSNIFATKLVSNLRNVGFSAEKDIAGKALKAQMKYADKMSAKFTVVTGETELETEVCTIKNMSTGEKFECKLSNISETLIEIM